MGKSRPMLLIIRRTWTELGRLGHDTKTWDLEHLAHGECPFIWTPGTCEVFCLNYQISLGYLSPDSDKLAHQFGNSGYLIARTFTPQPGCRHT